MRTTQKPTRNQISAGHPMLPIKGIVSNNNIIETIADEPFTDQDLFEFDPSKEISQTQSKIYLSGQFPDTVGSQAKI